jgi:hypothetical protein
MLEQMQLNVETIATGCVETTTTGGDETFATGCRDNCHWVLSQLPLGVETSTTGIWDKRN